MTTIADPAATPLAPGAAAAAAKGETAAQPKPAPAAGPSPRASARAGWLLAVLLTGQFMAILDVSIVNVAAPTIRTELGTTGSQLQLIIAGYTIVYAVLLITGSRIGARHGHRHVFMVGLAAFTLASLACGLAATAGQLIAFRFLQGAGAALMVPQILSLIQRTFDGAARARALSLYSVAIASGAVIGQISGGLLVAADLFGTSWRPVFLVNVPVGVALLLAARRLMPVDAGNRASGLDLPGVAVLLPTVLAFIVPLVLGHEQGWPAWAWWCLGASVVGLVAFVFVQRWVGRRGGAPLVPGRVLRVRGLVAATFVLFGAFVCYGGWLFSLALYVQDGLGRSPLQAGLIFMPGAIGFATAGLTWRRLPEGWHRGLIPAGLAVATLAYAGLAVLSFNAGPDGPNLFLFCLTLVLNGLGMGAAFSPVISVALTEVPAADAANASGLLTTTMQLAQAVGVATFGTLYLSLLAGHPLATTMGGSAVAMAVLEIATAAVALTLVRRRRA